MTGAGKGVFLNYLTSNHFYNRVHSQSYTKFQEPSPLTWIKICFKSVLSLIFSSLTLWGACPEGQTPLLPKPFQALLHMLCGVPAVFKGCAPCAVTPIAKKDLKCLVFIRTLHAPKLLK